MAFKIYKTDDGHVPAVEYLPCSAITPKAGMALKVTSGKLALATGTSAPAYISMCSKSSACTAGDLIPVIRVTPDIVFETTAAAALTEITAGTKVTLHTDALQVTATATSGVAEIVSMDSTASGSLVRVRF